MLVVQRANRPRCATVNPVKFGRNGRAHRRVGWLLSVCVGLVGCGAERPTPHMAETVPSGRGTTVAAAPPSPSASAIRPSTVDRAPPYPADFNYCEKPADKNSETAPRLGARIWFVGDSADIERAIGAYHLRELAFYLCQHPNSRVLVRGGGRDASVSTRRAQVVADALLAFGVCGNQVKAEPGGNHRGTRVSLVMPSVAEAERSCDRRSRESTPRLALPPPEQRMSMWRSVPAGPIPPGYRCKKPTGDDTVGGGVIQPTNAIEKVILDVTDGARNLDYMPFDAYVWDLCHQALRSAHFYFNASEANRQAARALVADVVAEMSRRGISADRVVTHLELFSAEGDDRLFFYARKKLSKPELLERALERLGRR